MKTLERNEAIIKHGEKLNTIFNTGLEPMALCKKLRRIEKKASFATTCLCNTNTLNLLEFNRYTGYDAKQATEAEHDKFFDGIRASLRKVLGEKADTLVFINFDPRGYALKIKSEKAEGLDIYKDWGGFGIIAPDLS